MEAASRDDEEALALALGRCVLQVQDLERALKSLLAGHHLSLHQGRFQGVDVSGKTLGGLAGLVNSSLLRPMAEEPSKTDQGDRATTTVRFQIALPDGDLDRMRQAFSALVASRNRAVHHLLEDHDLTVPEGRSSAIAALKVLTDQAAALRQEVALWTRDLSRNREELQAMLRDPDIQRQLLGLGDP